MQKEYTVDNFLDIEGAFNNVHSEAVIRAKETILTLILCI